MSRTKAKERSGRTAEAQKEGRSAQRRTLAKGAAGTSRRRATGGSGRITGPTKAELMERARKRNISGRSRMSKGELQRAHRNSPGHAVLALGAGVLGLNAQRSQTTHRQHSGVRALQTYRPCRINQ